MIKFNARRIRRRRGRRTTPCSKCSGRWCRSSFWSAIAIPSFRLLFFQLNTPPADLTIKATGKQWYLELRLSGQRQLRVQLLMLTDKERKPDQPRLLSVDNEIVVPVNKVVRVQVTGAEVIHAFAVPSFGVKIDAVPGRLNETWFKATRGHLLRPVLGAVRQGPRLHADRRRVVSEQDFHDMARGGQEEVRAAPTARPPWRKPTFPPSNRQRGYSASAATAATDERQSKESRSWIPTRHAHGGHDARRPRPPERMAPLRLFDQSQGHRHDVPRVRDHRRRRSAARCRSRCAWN